MTTTSSQVWNRYVATALPYRMSLAVEVQVGVFEGSLVPEKRANCSQKHVSKHEVVAFRLMSTHSEDA
jgi:hypothetical protein